MAVDVPKITERKIQGVLMQWAMERKNHQLVLPNNRTLFRWEADLLSATNSWLVHEYEVKLNIYDFRKDTDGSWRKKWKHQCMSNRYSGDGWRSPCPSYFWYATNGFDIPEGNLPPYAGWIRVYLDGTKWQVKIEKNAPRLHTDRLPEKRRVDAGRWLSYYLKNEYLRSEGA